MYFNIYDFAITEYNLSGNELLIYCLLLSFQATKYKGYATISTICKRVNCSERTAHYAIKNLQEKGLLLKSGTEFRALKGVEVCKNCTPKTAKIAPNNNINKKINIKNKVKDFLSHGVTQSGFDCWISHNDYTLKDNIINCTCENNSTLKEAMRYEDIIKIVFSVDEVNFFLKSCIA